MKAKLLLLAVLLTAVGIASYGLDVASTRGQTPENSRKGPSAPPGVPTPPPDVVERGPPTPTPSARGSLPPEPLPQTGTICDIPGRRAKGGETVTFDKVRIELPAGADYVVSPVITEDGPRIRVCIVQLNSALGILLDGSELIRTVNHPDAAAAIDAILRGIRVEP